LPLSLGEALIINECTGGGGGDAAA
jgi:hypothetical protein